MAERDDAAKYVYKQCKDLVDGRCYAVKQPAIQNEDMYPSIVYHIVGVERAVFISGLAKRSVRIRIDARVQQYEDLAALCERIEQVLADRMTMIYSETDAFDERAKVYRRLLSVGIHP